MHRDILKEKYAGIKKNSIRVVYESLFLTERGTLDRRLAQ